ncbi:rod-binding protein [Afifella sp. JA880]|uniref:rod-binding protein n=1 Tax=Afifella sp. JA880 TaxID=2975280 RepID=UPI0021BB8507|nr:rod-binding protein [Afifella sp. JA880]MCT8267859.1 rod-binding protein [Afifella sp. JA880]
MSISPPSDIVLDVARAASPTRYQEAAARLTRLSPSSGTTPAAYTAANDAFEDVFGQVTKPGATGPEETTKAAERPISPVIQMPFDSAQVLSRLKTSTSLAHSSLSSPKAGNDPMTGFEAMFLSTFVQTMLPASSDSMFGGGQAGEMWRSMLAQQIATQMAQAGGIGIAETVRTAETTPDLPENANGLI